MTQINIEPHLIPEITDRGFKHMPPMPATYPGTAIRAYESSAATEPCIWVTAYAENRESMTAVHLTVENALRLADQIQFLAANHYQILAEFADDESASRPPAAPEVDHG